MIPWFKGLAPFKYDIYSNLLKYNISWDSKTLIISHIKYNGDELEYIGIIFDNNK